MNEASFEIKAQNLSNVKENLNISGSYLNQVQWRNLRFYQGLQGATELDIPVPR
jgi:hypothetical protein